MINVCTKNTKKNKRQGNKIGLVYHKYYSNKKSIARLFFYNKNHFHGYFENWAEHGSWALWEDT